MSLSLRVAQVVERTEAEGPGVRFALWVQGCSLRCPGCCNPEMFAADRGGWLEDPRRLAERIIATSGIEGLSILGGEPFEQAGPLSALAERVHAAGLSVMVYSGYTLEELHGRADPAVGALLGHVDVLADGRFEVNNPEPTRRWLGSANQRLHFLTARYSAADPRFVAANTVELRLVNGQLVINGWPAGADAVRRGAR